MAGSLQLGHSPPHRRARAQARVRRHITPTTDGPSSATGRLRDPHHNGAHREGFTQLKRRAGENPSVKRSCSAVQLLPTPGGPLSLLPSPQSSYCQVALVREESTHFSVGGVAAWAARHASMEAPGARSILGRTGARRCAELRFVLAQNNHKTTTTTIYSSKDYATNGFGTNTIRLLDFNKAVQQHASTTQLPTTIPLAPGMGRGLWVGYKVAGSLDQGHQGRVCRHYKRPASDPTHYDSASVNIGVKRWGHLVRLLLSGLESTHNHLAGDPTHYEYIGVKAKLLAQLLAGSRREHPWFYT
ncbi:hypothetical protein B0H14DRAFT_3143099 [Mycena olivaceomarginata]|nr:hypothetical protein B0H14DRAFT_3143099 [Mycena olivaceomarginata]